MQTRPSARLLILDPQDRVLLFRTESFSMDRVNPIPAYWYVPGGGLEDGESFEDAASRELWEETGIQGAEIGPCVWYREQVLYFSRIGEALAHERFFPVHVPDNNIDFVNMIDQEALVMTGHRWWSIEDLRDTTDTVFPRDISTLLPPILAGVMPAEPIKIR